TGQSVAADGSPGAVGVTAPDGCAWSSSSTVSWITAVPSGVRIVKRVVLCCAKYHNIRPHWNLEHCRQHVHRYSGSWPPALHVFRFHHRTERRRIGGIGIDCHYDREWLHVDLGRAIRLGRFWRLKAERDPAALGSASHRTLRLRAEPRI